MKERRRKGRREEVREEGKRRGGKRREGRGRHSKASLGRLVGRGTHQTEAGCSRQGAGRNKQIGSSGLDVIKFEDSLRHVGTNGRKAIGQPQCSLDASANKPIQSGPATY